jgi:hypothetical protein
MITESQIGIGIFGNFRTAISGVAQFTADQELD